ncbi:MAG: uracil-DNA glycosylase [Pseudomonadota bacterium]
MDEVRAAHPSYHARPVAPFGASDPRLLIVGLAPGLHGANATGRPFTGDFAGILLYNTLFELGFSSRPESRSVADGLTLNGCRITNAVKCLPPQNKPLGAEIIACNAYLKVELAGLRRGAVVLALGGIAHSAVLRALGLKASAHKFRHGAVHALSDQRWLIDSYHCSRYNTQTKRLTATAFKAVFEQARNLIHHESS